MDVNYHTRTLLAFLKVSSQLSGSSGIRNKHPCSNRVSGFRLELRSEVGMSHPMSEGDIISSRRLFVGRLNIPPGLSLFFLVPWYGLFVSGCGRCVFVDLLQSPAGLRVSACYFCRQIIFFLVLLLILRYQI